MGAFLLTAETPIFADAPNQANAAYLQTLLSPPTGYSFPIEEIDPEGRGIHLFLEAIGEDYGEEGYRIEVNPGKAQIYAHTPVGVFYGIQTLRQLLPVEIENREAVPDMTWEIPYITLMDYPRFPWRGYLLDEARHFQGKETVKDILDQMARLKLNRFHWHLTDDQGWRIEIKQYPKLTEIGSVRPGTVVGNPFLSSKHDEQPHAGFYTQDEIREVVSYAQALHIMVIPEIELPGHASAALAAYPELGCTGQPVEVATRFGIFNNIYCAGKENTYIFLENVLKEVASLFPAPYLHIGGDEAPKKNWKQCPDCQQKIQDLGLKDEDALQVWLTNWAAALLAEAGKTIIFWSDAYHPEIDPSAIVHFWKGDQKKIFQAVRDGRKMINSTYLRTYLDHAYKLLPLDETYAFDPLPAELAGPPEKNVLGMEGLLWTEWGAQPGAPRLPDLPAAGGIGRVWMDDG